MKPVWEIDGDDVALLQGKSPDFVRFLNALLTFQAHEARVSDTFIHLNQKDSEGDGGVDAAIDQPIRFESDPTDRFGVPTCWQFKARPVAQIKAKGGQQAALRRWINDPHVCRLIEQGYGYRLCIADDMPHEKKTKWEGWLRTAAQEINVGVPAPMVLTASDLANWANRFKPIVSAYFRPYLGQFRSLERCAKKSLVSHQNSSRSRDGTPPSSRSGSTQTSAVQSLPFSQCMERLVSEKLAVPVRHSSMTQGIMPSSCTPTTKRRPLSLPTSSLALII